MSRIRLEIICTSCGKDTLLVRTPKYEGFTRAGEILRCSSCGHEYASETDVPFKGVKSAPKIFKESDYSSKPRVFKPGEEVKMCLHCSHYVVNPFSQRCGLTFKNVQATDSCNDFERREEKEEDGKGG